MRELPLKKAIENYSERDPVRFHMPGHKRNIPVAGVDTSLDITEITGFDDLHFSRGILKAAQDEAAESYGAMEAFYLVNGSTEIHDKADLNDAQDYHGSS